MIKDRLIMKRGDTAIITKSALKYKLGKWRIYDVVFQTKSVTLILDHEVKPRYRNLFRVTNYLFVGQIKEEDKK